MQREKSPNLEKLFYRKWAGLLVWALIVGLFLAPASVSAADDASPPSKPAMSLEEMTLAKVRMKIKANKYESAIPMLMDVVMANPRNADAHNLLGYSYRKLGRYPEASQAYLKALEIDPDHKGALEYQGELFLKLGQLYKAEQNLNRLSALCWFGCEEHTDLKKAIAAYKAKGGS